jgi:hypothetical protein
MLRKLGLLGNKCIHDRQRGIVQHRLSVRANNLEVVFQNAGESPLRQLNGLELVIS